MLKKLNKAFTLAEILVTLMIIGVIAALTIPTLKETTDKSANLALLQKAYSTVSNAFSQLEAEYGSPIYWLLPEEAGASLGGERAFKSTDPAAFSWMLQQKMIVAKSGDIVPSDYVVYTLAGSTHPKTSGKVEQKKLAYDKGFQTADNMYWFLSETYQNCAQEDSSRRVKHSPFSLWGAPAYAAITPSRGEAKPFTANLCGYIMVDTNGGKQPNRLGLDVFVFDVTTSGIKPHQEENDDCASFSSENRGYTCAYKMLKGDPNSVNFIYE